MGIGPHTQGALTTVGDGARIVTVVESGAQSVRVVDEDGRTDQVPRPLVAAAGLRVAHPGQRIVVETSDDGSTSVRLP